VLYLLWIAPRYVALDVAILGLKNGRTQSLCSCVCFSTSQGREACINGVDCTLKEDKSINAFRLVKGICGVQSDGEKMQSKTSTLEPPPVRHALGVYAAVAGVGVPGRQPRERREMKQTRNRSLSASGTSTLNPSAHSWRRGEQTRAKRRTATSPPSRRSHAAARERIGNAPERQLQSRPELARRRHVERVQRPVVDTHHAQVVPNPLQRRIHPPPQHRKTAHNHTLSQ
jgi:hypothetical protein